MKNIIVADYMDSENERQIEAWGSLTELCRVHRLPYHSIKMKDFPFYYDGYYLYKVKFRHKANGTNSN